SLLLVVIHHIISDGWSMGVLVRELATAYEARWRGVAPPLPDLPIQYADYVVWQRQQLEGAALERLLAYWTRRFEGAAPLLQLPQARTRPAVQTFAGATCSAAFDPALTADIKALAHRNDATLFMIFLAAFEALLFRYTGQEDLVIGTPIANQRHPKFE